MIKFAYTVIVSMFIYYARLAYQILYFLFTFKFFSYGDVYVINTYEHKHMPFGSIYAKFGKNELHIYDDIYQYYMGRDAKISEDCRSLMQPVDFSKGQRANE